MDNFSFDRSELPTGKPSYSLIPDGWYPMTVDKAELVDIKGDKGQQIKITYKITGPEQNGRLIFGYIAIKHVESDKEAKGRQRLGNLVDAAKFTDKITLDNITSLHFEGKVITDKGSEGYEDRNSVLVYRELKNPLPGMPAPNSSPQTNTSAKKKPWEK